MSVLSTTWLRPRNCKCSYIFDTFVHFVYSCSEGIPRNMLKGLSNEMLHDVMEGKSPLCAIEKRATNGKMMAFNIGKAYGLIPPMSHMRTYLDDEHEFWNQKYLAQTDNELEAMTDAEVDMLMDDTLTLSQIYPNIQC